MALGLNALAGPAAKHGLCSPQLILHVLAKAGRVAASECASGLVAEK